MLSGFNPETIQNLEGARQAITALLNLVETMQISIYISSVFL